jgi:amino acid adenylation domain-containing protein
MAAASAGGLRVRLREEVDNGCAKFDLLLFVDGPTLTAEYDTDLFDPSTVERFLAHYVRLLDGAAADPARRVSRLPLLTAAERALCRPAPAVAYPDGDCLHDLVAEQAARTPDRTAVEFEGAALSYAELDRRANRLAHRLRGAGVGPDTPVALCVERSLELAVAVLGILRAGGAYVPLDPAYPAARLAQVLADVAAPVLVAPPGVLPAAAATRIDPGGADLAALPATAPPPAAGPGNLAYVLFTSGSTGRPKGVAMPHRPIVNLVSWQRTAGGLGEPARTLQFAATGFDVSCQEMFGTWGCGGTLVMVRDEVRRDPAALLSYLDSAGIERLFLPFVALQHLAEAAGEIGRAPIRLRDIVTAGEQLQITPQVAALLAALPDAALHNHYGPTETHVATAHTLCGDPARWPALPPIGRPIANAYAGILDRYGQPVPVGVPGELFLGGVCVARGYHDRPELTAERFVPDPLAAAGERMYRTGDLGRWRADGTIEYLGRADDQVKIRGYRVEPGEIEAVLAALPEVRDTAVVADEAAGVRRLVGCVVPAAPGGSDALAARCRTAVEAALPEYMVPAAFVFLDALPLTPSGKIDRRALTLLAPDARTTAQSVEAPETTVERAVALVWGDVLDVPDVGRHDDFFRLGGHSLVATRVIARLREALDVDVPLRCLFANPTVAGFAAALAAEHGAELDESAQLFLMVVAYSDDEAAELLGSLRS